MDFKWTNRYSNTEKPDKHGRWARLCYCNGFVIGEIFLERYFTEKLYTVIYRFPAAHGKDTIGYRRIKGSALRTLRKSGYGAGIQNLYQTGNEVSSLINGT